MVLLYCGRVGRRRVFIPHSNARPQTGFTVLGTIPVLRYNYRILSPVSELQPHSRCYPSVTHSF